MAKKLPTRKEAALILVDESWRERRRKSSFAKCSVALMVLGLDNVEVIEVLERLELCDLNGKAFP